jgi:hypothetical protein
MYSGDSFEEATDRVSQFLEDISDVEVAGTEYTLSENEPMDGETDGSQEEDETYNDESRETRRRVLYANEPVGPDYTVVADEGDRYFTLQSRYQLWPDIAQYLSQEKAESIAPEDVNEDHPVRSHVPKFADYEESDQIRLTAAIEILSDLSDNDRRELIIQLTNIFTDAGLKHSIGEVNSATGITGFTVFHRVFPYEDSFTIGDLNKILERVRMATHMGELVLKYTFNLPVDIEGTTGGDVTEPGQLPTRYDDVQLEGEILESE